MKTRGEYSVRISGLNNGVHEFEFDIGNSFFKLMNHPDISGGGVNAKIILEKKHEILSLSFILKGALNVICDRCLDSFMQPIEVSELMYVKFGENVGEINENIMVIEKEAHEIIVDHYLFEFMVLALPYKRIHPDKENGDPGCNSEMLAKLNEHIIKKENETNDPRWDELKRLIEKNN